MSPMRLHRLCNISIVGATSRILCCLMSARSKASVAPDVSVHVGAGCRRYPIEYPHQPLVVKIIGTKGLTASDSRALSKLLNSSSSEHAKDGVVAGFSLADACQEFLLGRNSPEAVKNDSTVIQHC